MTTHTITLTDAQRQTLKVLAAWAQTSASLSEAETAVLDHILREPAPIAVPEGRTMKEYRLTIDGSAPVTFCGVHLTDREIFGSFVATDVHVFRTKSGEYLLYVGSVGYQTTRTHAQRLYRHADRMTAQEVISACLGRVDDAKPALQALGLNTVERIA